MYLLKSMTMKSICQYDSQEIDFDKGLTAVCGRNGSGKSTLLRALAYGLTGLVDGSWGTQKDLQKDGIIVPGYVTVVLADLDGGRTLTIKRYATGGPKYADSITETKDDTTKEVALRRQAVDAYLADCYGISCRLLFQIFWLRQSQIDLLLTSPAAQVNAFLAEVFDMRGIETVRDRIKTTVDSIATGFAGTAEEIAATEGELENLPTAESIEEGLAAVDAEMAEREKEHDAFMQKYGRDLDMDDTEQRYKKLKNDIAGYRKTLELVNETLSKLNGPIEHPDMEGLSIQQLDDAILHQEERVRQLRRNMDAAESAEKSAATTRLDLIRREEEMVGKLMCPDKCELCGGPVTDPDMYMHKQCKLLTGFDTVHEFKDSIAAAVKKAETAESTNKATHKQYAEALGIQEATLHTMQEKRKQYANAELWREKNTTKATCAALLKSMVPEMQKLEVLVNRGDEIRQKMDEINANTKELKRIYDEAHGMAARVKERRELLTNQLEKLKKRLEQETINREARTVLMDLRDGLSTSRVQARYLASKIREINRNLSHFMTYTGMPFSLYLREDAHTFAFKTADGYEHPSVHLSGAQKNMSAVALQMALFTVIHPNINLFLIDEPSEALDDGNKVVMADMFQRMNNMLSAMNGTMLIVSRDDKMVESCETVLTVGS